MASEEISKKSKKDQTDLKIVTRDEDEATFVADVFGEKFTFSSDANGWLVFMASTGKAEHLERLIHSMIIVDIDEDMTENEARVARMREADRFTETLGTQKNFGIERMFRLVNDIIEAAGNVPTDS
jgi:hypothetical protein